MMPYPKPFLIAIIFWASTLLASSVAASDSNVYRSYQTSIYCNPSTAIQEPKTPASVVQIVHNAILNGEAVKAFGSRHSLTDTICTDGVPISMANINYKQVNPDGTATFGAGIELFHALEFLELNGLSLIHVPTYGGITIGGAIGTGAHGSSLRHPNSISDQVVRLTVIAGNGSVITVSSPEEVNAFRVHLGLLGVILDVTLQTVPLFKMTIENKPTSDSILFDNSVPTRAQQADMFQMWWFPHVGRVVVGTGNYVDVKTPGNASSNLIPDESPVLVAASNEAFEVLQLTRNTAALNAFGSFTELSLYSEVIGKPPIYSEDGRTVANPATGYAWRLQANICGNETLARCSWFNGDSHSLYPEESSIAFDISEFSGVMTMVKDIHKRFPAAFALIGVYIRFSKASPSLMGISSGRTTFTVEWTTPMRNSPFDTSRDGIETFQAILQEMVTNYGGRPHWGKNGLYYTTQSVLAKSVPNRQAFISAMKTYDPTGIFMNKFGQRILGVSDAMDKDPRVIHCALQDYCVCKADADCARLQRCTTINNFPVCKDKFPSYPQKFIFNKFSDLTAILEVIGIVPKLFNRLLSIFD